MSQKKSEFKKETIVENEKSNLKAGNRVVYFRWLFIAFILPAFLHVSKLSVPLFVFLETLAIVVVYNIFATSSLLRKNGDKKIAARIINFIDVIIICVFSYQLGGINSEIYIILLFVIGLCGLYSDTSRVLGIGSFAVVAYTISTLLAARSSGEEFKTWNLSLRIFFLMLAAYGISFIIGEAKKYNELHKREFKLARTDKLTGLANRHYLDQKLQEEVDYSDFSGEPLNILIFDLDNFKKFNDSYGHIWGDKLLTLFSDIIKQNVRKSDIPVRYGGEEFLILIRGLSIDMAKSVGDRIRRQLEKQRIYVGSEDNRKRVTVSCGVAQYPKHSKNVKEVIDLADKALYHAKEIGKNVVVGIDEIGFVQNTEQIDIDMFLER